MSMTFPHFDSRDLPYNVEPGFPCFLDGCADDVDDLGDWWLDLGSVDFAASSGM